ncbi:MAG: hypothetical protein ACR2HQ_03710 [Ilumatobacteraceae bacterium]
MPTLVEKILSIAESLAKHDVPYAFGGALALAYATEDPRGTRDIDVNVFVPAADVLTVFAALPSAVARDDDDVTDVCRDEQVRLWWDDTPVDVFFAAHAFHLAAGRRARRVDFVGIPIPVLAPCDLTVFKVLFDRSKDWVDIEAMVASGTLDVDEAVEAVSEVLGDDPRVDRLAQLRT